MGGVAYVDWIARAEVAHGLKDKHLRKVEISDGCYLSRRHLNADRTLGDGDEFIDFKVQGNARASITCEMLSPEDLLILAETEAYLQQLEDEDTTGTIDEDCVAYGSGYFKEKEPSGPHIDINEKYYYLEHPEQAQLPAEPDDSPQPTLAEFYTELFGISKADHHDLDERHFGICCKQPKVPYRSRPNWATT